MTLRLFLLLCCLATPLAAQENRGLNFEGMDTNADGVVTRAEWMVWFLPDSRARLGAQPEAATPGRSARPMTQGVDQGVDDARFQAESFNRAARGTGIPTQEGVIAQRDRLRAFDGRRAPQMPSFDSFDRDGNQVLTREELARRIPTIPQHALGPYERSNY
jgi:hypothetical protein